MSDVKLGRAAAPLPVPDAENPYSVEIRRAGGGETLKSWGFPTQAEAMQRFKDATEEFKAVRPLPGANVALKGPTLATSAGYVSEGKGLAQLQFGSDELRSAYEAQSRSAPEQRADLLTDRDRERLHGVSQRPEVAADPVAITQADLDRLAAARARDLTKAREALGFQEGNRSEALVSDASTATIDRSGKAVEVRTQDGNVERLSTSEQVAAYAEKNTMSGADRSKLMQMDEEALKGPVTDRADPATVGSKVDQVDEDPLRKRFLKTDHGYLDKSTHVVAIEDKGTKLQTEREDAYVVESMAIAAKARGWTEVAVSGTAAFRREAWFQLTLQNIAVTGFSPSRDDFQWLDAYKAERAHEAGRESSQRAAAAGVDAASQARFEAPPGAELVAHGAAKYMHDPKSSDSYYVTTRDSRGAERTTWGVDLERAMTESGAKVGDQVILRNEGVRPVTITVPVLDADGQKIGAEEKVASRNAWNIAVANLSADRRAVATTVEKLASQAGVSGDALARARNEIARVATTAKAVPPVKVVDSTLRTPQAVVTPPRPKSRDFQR